MIRVFTDGAAKGNGKFNCTAGFSSVMVIDNIIRCTYGRVEPFKYILLDGKLAVTEEEIKPTNNRAELLGIIVTMIKLKKLNYEIISDSNYSINSITKWMNGWKEKGYFGTNEKQNMDLFEIIYNLYDPKKIQFTHIEAHKLKNKISLFEILELKKNPIPKTDQQYNDIADVLACEGANSDDFELKHI